MEKNLSQLRREPNGFQRKLIAPRSRLVRVLQAVDAYPELRGGRWPLEFMGPLKYPLWSRKPTSLSFLSFYHSYVNTFAAYIRGSFHRKLNSSNLEIQLLRPCSVIYSNRDYLFILVLLQLLVVSLSKGIWMKREWKKRDVVRSNWGGSEYDRFCVAWFSDGD